MLEPATASVVLYCVALLLRGRAGARLLARRLHGEEHTLSEIALEEAFGAGGDGMLLVLFVLAALAAHPNYARLMAGSVAALGSIKARPLPLRCPSLLVAPGHRRSLLSAPSHFPTSPAAPSHTPPQLVAPSHSLVAPSHTPPQPVAPSHSLVAPSQLPPRLSTPSHFPPRLSAPSHFPPQPAVKNHPAPIAPGHRFVCEPPASRFLPKTPPAASTLRRSASTSSLLSLL